MKKVTTKEGKIQIKQFKDLSSNWFVNHTHYCLNKDNEIVWCAGETDKEELRDALSSYIRRNKKKFKEREPSIFEQEEKEYSKIGFGKYSQMSTIELVAQDRKYASWIVKNSADKKLVEELKQLLKAK